MKQYLDTEHYRVYQVGSPVFQMNQYTVEELTLKDVPDLSFKYRMFQLLLNYGCGLVALPVIAIISAVLLVLNPFLNPGPLFFRQERVGQFGKPFQMWKFRTMRVATQEARDPTAALEEDRIPKLGRALRKTRLDEIPNLLNVLRGEMNVIGPRPDAASHFNYYSGRVCGYPERHRVKPGITGLAQVEQGYTEDADATAVKAKYDNLYVERLCGRLDIYILRRTVRVMLGGIGAK